MQIARAAMNPLISPLSVTPSSPDMQVLCAFNAAALRWGDDTFLLMRVAEAPAHIKDDEVAIPVMEHTEFGYQVAIRYFRKSDPELDLSDPRGIVYKGEALLTSLSHLRLARSRDGYDFTIDARPAIFPTEHYEEYGIEDPRMTLIGDTIYITYTAVSRYGVCVALALTQDLITFTKLGIALPPENKNAVIFPEKVHGEYVMIHRPSTTGLGSQQMWLAYSRDMKHWGQHRPLMQKRPGMWDDLRIGAGATPIKTDHGWLEIYHGVNTEQGYCLGAVLLDLNDPSKVLARSAVPLLIPEADYERVGFFGNVVFTCGAVASNAGDGEDVVQIYYGASDQYTCRVDIALEDIIASLRKV